MPTARFAMLLIIMPAFLVSCHHKKAAAPQAKTISTGKADVVTEKPIESIGLNDLSSAWQQKETQHFTVSPKKITVLKGKKGLKITITPAALEKADGSPVDGPVNVQLIELTNTDDIFRANAATVSNGRLLASGGSYYVGMECSGQQVKIKNQCHLEMQFPKLQEKAMELFYGTRDADGNMNWQPAGKALSFEEVMQYTSYQLPYPDVYTPSRFKSKYRMYSSLKDKVYFDDKLVTIKDMVAALQSKNIDKQIDTLRIPLHEFYYDLTYNPTFSYDTVVRYRILSGRQIQEEKDSIKQVTARLEEQKKANEKYREQWAAANRNTTLQQQVQNYYGPTNVSQLGWLNCDRFYNSPQNIEVPFDMPYTFNTPVVHYFVLYKSFTGMISGKIRKNARQQYVLPNLAAGQEITLIAFAKNNGQVYQCRQEFSVQPGKVLKADFKPVPAEELCKIFGRNVKV